MSETSALLRFDRDHPVWTEDLFARAGEDPQDLRSLSRSGLLEERSGVWGLSPAGREAFRAEAAECFLEAEPGEAPEDRARSLERTQLALLLDRAFRGRWGLKEFRPGARLAYWPGLSPRDRCRIEEGTVRWTLEDHPAVRALDRSGPFASLEEVGAFRDPWGLPFGTLELDLLLVFRYDFHCYQDQRRLPTDLEGFADTDRLLCRLLGPAPSLEDLASHLGEVHLFLREQRGLLLPGRFDRDAQEQDSVTWWVGVCDGEAQARELARTWGPLGEALGTPSLPLDLWLVSREALEEAEPQESFWDLFSQVGHRLFCPA